MKLSDEINQIGTIFIDTAPIIYYIEAHPRFGPLAKEVIDACQYRVLIAYSSVIILTEVLPKPVQEGREDLADRFAEFLIRGKNFNLIAISTDIAEKAGRLRGKYPFLKAMDAIQLAAAIHKNVDAFLTNDKSLKQVKELKILMLSDYESEEEIYV